MAAPANDTCATAAVIAALPFSETVDVTDATHGPDPTCVTDAEHTIFYTWTAPDATPITITYGDDREWGTILTIYTGTCGALTEVLCEAPLSVPAVTYFGPTASVAYILQFSLYDGVLDDFATVAMTLGIGAASLPTPVLAGTSTTGRTVSLTWASLAGTPAETVSVERSLDGTTWSVVASVGALASYVDRGLASSTLYHHRVRAHHATLGDGPYSNTVTTTTLANTVGIAQYGFAIGGTGSFGRNQLVNEDGSASGYPATFEVYGVCQLWEVTNALETQPGGPGTTLYTTAKLALKYQVGPTEQTAITSGYVLSTQQQTPVGPSDQFQVQYTNINNQVDLWGKLGSVDTLTNTHKADGFITVTLNGAVIFDLQNIALGTQGTAAWSNVRFHPAGTFTFRTPDGSGIDQNGGASHFYVGTTGEQGAHDIFDYSFATVTDDELFGASGPWRRENGIVGTSTAVPTVWDGRLSNSSEGSFAVGWMNLKGTDLITPPPGPPPDEPGGGRLPPYVAPSYHLDARYIRRLRRAPHVNNDNKRVFVRTFELDLERGQGLATGQGADPMVLLRISRDGGQTWGEESRMAAGRLGAYTTRVLARRLGQARDTVFEVVVSDPIAWALVGAWLDLEPGTS